MKLEKGNYVFKQKKNDIDIVFNNKVQLTDNEVLTQAAPEWFKHMPHNSQPGINQRFLNGKTAKTCPGVWDYFNNTYMLRWWTDISITVDGPNIEINPEEGEHTFVKVNGFSPDKYGDYVPDMKHKTLLKFHAPFAMVSKQHSRLLCEDSYYAYNKDYRVVPGIVDPYYSNQVIVMLELYNDNIQITKGDPAMLFVPLDNQKINNRLVTTDDLQHINNIQSYFKTKFSGGYKDAKKSNVV